VTSVPKHANAMMAVETPSSSTAGATDFCYGLPGNIAPAGNFDPASLLEGRSKSEVYRFREAEITHGRVGMLAAAGFLVQENFHPLFSGAGGPAIQQIPELPPWVWFLMTLGIGIAEASRIQLGWANPYESPDKVQSLKDDYYPGGALSPPPLHRVSPRTAWTTPARPTAKRGRPPHLPHARVAVGRPEVRPARPQAGGPG